MAHSGTRGMKSRGKAAVVRDTAKSTVEKAGNMR
jgi:hypothetical protein